MKIHQKATQTPSYPIHFKADLLDTELDFHTTYGVFSPKGIDKGTLLLLDYLDCFDGARVLDLGAGYGPIGLAVAKKFPNTTVEMVDKDFVAIECIEHNLKANQITNAKAYLSDGLKHTSGIYDRIYCNLPAKIGNELTLIFLQDCKNQLAENGLMQWVCINSLREYMKRVALEIFGNFKKIKQGAQYTVIQIHASKSSTHR